MAQQTQHDAREAASDDVMENEGNEEDMDEIASAIVDKVSLAAKKDSAQEKAEREKRDRVISNALHEKELAKRSSTKWKQMRKIRENLPARKARSLSRIPSPDRLASHRVAPPTARECDRN